MKNALIGHTGFVGSNILSQVKFTHTFNSKDIDKIHSDSYDLVVCAGLPAVKWWANKHPEDDFSVVQALAANLEKLKCDRFVLISTVDVYQHPANVTESTNLDPLAISPYGRNRLWLEHEIKKYFHKSHIVRLPALYGPGLKKNILFDLITNNMLEKINCQSTFQWYPLSRIWSDIQQTTQNEISLLNISVQPIKTQTILQTFFPDKKVGSDPLPEAHYDVRSEYATIFNKNSSSYILSAEDSLRHMGRWLLNPGVCRA